MLKELLNHKEKKVEYIELIYDLMFVYILRRNCGLLHHIEDGFIPVNIYLTGVLITLTVLQVWYCTTAFINRYGTNSIAEYVMLFINMFLLYYMADTAHASWQEQYTQFSVAWALILINIAVQYCLKLRSDAGRDPVTRRHLFYNIFLLAGEAAVILLSVPVFRATGLTLSPAALVVGVLAALTFGRRVSGNVPADFGHLSERIMLFVVLAFGEMIISLSDYFSGGITVRSVYFALMGFLIVAGLFFTYGYCYDHIIDREKATSGVGYMMVHILMITVMTNITVALEFMREPEADEGKKVVFLVISFILFFAFLFLLLPYAKPYHKPSRSFLLIIVGLTAVFAVLMAALYRDNVASIAVTVAYIYSMFAATVIIGVKASRKNRMQNATEPNAE